MTATAERESPAGERVTNRDGPRIHLGVVVTPALDEPVFERLAEDLAEALSRRYPGVNWELAMVRELLLTPPATLPDVVDAARSRLLDEDWDLVVYVTE